MMLKGRSLMRTERSAASRNTVSRKASVSVQARAASDDMGFATMRDGENWGWLEFMRWRGDIAMLSRIFI